MEAVKAAEGLRAAAAAAGMAKAVTGQVAAG
jgi:hypothetical protein